jgi:hypothetical protein
MKRLMFVPVVALLALTALASCKSDQDNAQAAGGGIGSGSNGSGARYSSLHLPSGTAIDVTLGTGLSSETANVGSAWSGVLQNALYVDGRNVVPAGSAAGGTVTGVLAAKRGDRAMLDLGLGWFSVGGKEYRVNGSTPSVIAGSTRARNLGAIAAATVAGAVVGHAIGGSGKGTLIGAVVGGGAATGVVSQTKGWQVLLKPGMTLTFTTSEAVAVRQ